MKLRRQECLRIEKGNLYVKQEAILLGHVEMSIHKKYVACEWMDGQQWMVVLCVLSAQKLKYNSMGVVQEFSAAVFYYEWNKEGE